MLAQDDEEHLVPQEMWPRFQELIAAFVTGDFQLSRHVLDGVAPIDAETAQFIRGQIAAYGDSLAVLSDDVRQRSAYRWMDGYWEFLIDLSTSREPVSDLALHTKLFDGLGGELKSGRYTYLESDNHTLAPLLSSAPRLASSPKSNLKWQRNVHPWR